jgi:predicted amidohydrolase YtcJ
MKSRKLLLFAIIAMCFILWASIANAQNKKPIQKKNIETSSQNADFVFKNGAIYTIDSKNPKAEAIAITGKKISYVGNNAGVQAFIGNKTKVTDLHGQMLLPGFIESHIHPTLALFTKGADLQYDNINDLLINLKKWGDEHPNDKVIQGFGWRYFLFPTTGPTKAELDKLFPDRPVMLIAIDVHSAWVNSKALEIAGINAKSPDPAPGLSYFQRDPKTGEPTGWVVETMAEQELLAKLAPPTLEVVNDATAGQLSKFSAAGITSAFDAGIATIPTESGFEAYQQLEKEHKLPLRIVGCYYWNNPAITDPVSKLILLHKKFNSELVQINTLKIMYDGGESQHTAVMFKPYADQPDSYGDFQLNPKLVAAAVLKAQANGLNTHAHSYGDSTTLTYLDNIEQAKKAYPNSPSRHTAAHAMFLTDKEITRFVKMNVTMQTSAQWFTPDPTLELMMKIVGKDIVSTEYARLNSMLKAGGRLALGTDWPASGWVATFRPLDAIQVALTRAILPQYGKQQVMPVLPPENERITLDQALKAYTLDAAYVLGLENKIGSLKVGKAADIIVLEKDLYKIAASEISTTNVKLTMMNGKITYQGQ